MVNLLNLSAFNKVNQNISVNKSQTAPFNKGNLNFYNLKADTVSFGNSESIAETQKAGEKKELYYARKKLIAHANDLLKNEIKLKPGQPLKITADKKFLPFIEILQNQAYKMGSGKVIVDIKDQKLEELYKKHGKYPNTKWKSARYDDLKRDGAAFIEFKRQNSPFKLAGLTPSEVNTINNSYKIDIPKSVAKKLELDPKDVLEGMLGMKKGQPLLISAEREHEPNVYKIAEYALKNGYGPVDVVFTEPKNRLSRSFLKHAQSEELLTNIPQYQIDKYQQYLDAGTARLRLYGADPKALAGINPDKISKNSKATSKALSPISEKMIERNPWTILYAPTTMSSLSAYPNIKDPIKALAAAANDAPEILRKGKFGEHAKELERRAKAVNDLNLDEIHFISVDPQTKEPDGKTNLYVGLTPKAKFMSAYEKTPDGQKYVANVPTEEVFNSPDKTKTHGWVTSTLPLSLNGNLVEGIRMEFEDGKAVKVTADKNEKIIQDHVKTDEGASMLGEVALVAGSPIRKISEKKGGVFNNTLLDENAVCHIAVGRGFSSCVQGYNDLKGEDEKKALLEEIKINDSAIHTDFMIGGPNVIVEGIRRDENGDETKTTIIKDDKFQI